MLTFKDFCKNDGVALINEARELYLQYEAVTFNADVAIQKLDTVIATVKKYSLKNPDDIKIELNEKGINPKSETLKLDIFINSPGNVDDEDYRKTYYSFINMIPDEYVWQMITIVEQIQKTAADDKYLLDIAQYLLVILHAKYKNYIGSNIRQQYASKQNMGFAMNASKNDQEDENQSVWLDELKQIADGKIDREKAETDSLIPKLNGDLMKVRNSLNTARTRGATIENDAISVDKLKEGDDGEKQQDVVPVDDRPRPDQAASTGDMSGYLREKMNDGTLNETEKAIFDAILDSTDADEIFKKNSEKEDLPVQQISISNLYRLTNDNMKKQGKAEIPYRMIKIALQNGIDKIKTALAKDNAGVA